MSLGGLCGALSPAMLEIKTAGPDRKLKARKELPPRWGGASVAPRRPVLKPSASNRRGTHFME